MDKPGRRSARGRAGPLAALAVTLLAVAGSGVHAETEHAGDTGSRAAAVALDSWTADYRVQYGGSTVGEAHFELTDLDTVGVRRLESRTKAKGIARLLRSREVVESSTFTAGLGLRPLAYRFEDGTRRGKKNMQIDFDHERAVALSLYQGDTYELELDCEVHDRVLVILAMMRDAAADDLAPGYRVADKREVKTYQLEGPLRETVETPVGAFETLHYTRRREGSSRVMEMWLAPELDYLPVRMRHSKEGKETARLELTASSKLP
ncbi:MAG: DUF3108 domain-containing protein [Pseudomonadota bacterium]